MNLFFIKYKRMVLAEVPTISTIFMSIVEDISNSRAQYQSEFRALRNRAGIEAGRERRQGRRFRGPHRDPLSA